MQLSRHDLVQLDEKYPCRFQRVSIVSRFPRACALADRTCVWQAQGHRPRPRILFGLGAEGGEPIYIQAQEFVSGRLPGHSPLSRYITPPCPSLSTEHTRSGFSLTYADLRRR